MQTTPDTPGTNQATPPAAPVQPIQPTQSAQSAQPVIHAEGLSCGYGTSTILRDVSFTLHHGEALGLIGANGSGKSTLLKATVGLCDVRGTLHTPKVIGYVPQHQEVDLTFPVTARHVVEMGLYRQTPWWRRVDTTKVNAALQLVGLADKAHHRFGDLSGGQRQRVLIARALVTDPQLILLDEPFNGLDITSRDILIANIHTVKARGTAVMVSTHDYSLAAQVCERSAAISDGRVSIHDTQQVIG